MDRREAIKKIVLSTGVVVSSVSLMSVMQACQTREGLVWSPKFFTLEHANVISVITNIIIPKTDIPGANEAEVTQFIDLLYKDIFDDSEGEKLRLGIQEFTEQFEKKHHKNFTNSDNEQQVSFITSLYQHDDATTHELYKLVQNQHVNDSQKPLQQLYSFLFSIRELTIEAYFTSELIGETVLAYDPVPGGYRGCIDIDQNTRTWSL